MIDNIQIIKENISNYELKICAKIHSNEIKGGLLKSLGSDFLYRIYQHISISKNSFLITIKYKNDVIGFFAGCFNQKKFYIEFIRNNFFFILKYIFKLLNIDNMSKILLINNFFLKKRQNLPEALILNFCIDKNFQSKGLGKLLLNEAIKLFKIREINEIKIKTSSDQLKAINLYKSYGAITKKDSINSKSQNNEILFLLKLN